MRYFLLFSVNFVFYVVFYNYDDSVVSPTLCLRLSPRQAVQNIYLLSVFLHPNLIFFFDFWKIFFVTLTEICFLKFFLEIPVNFNICF